MPDQLHVALGRVLSDYHWRAFCDAWLAIGFASYSVEALAFDMNAPDDEARAYIARLVGRVRRKPLKRGKV